MDQAAVGGLLREWRQRRRMSQLELALAAEISARHLSFIETGRAQPSRDMVLRLAERLEVPLRERNMLLTAAGYAPMFPQRRYEDAALAPARRTIELLLKGHEPYPALAIDRHWSLLAANAAVGRLLTGVDADLMAPPVNVLRLSLHPRGLGPRIANYGEWRAHVLARLRQQSELTADLKLIALMQEIAAYPVPPIRRPPTPATDYGGIAVPFQLVSDLGVLSFFSTTTIFGTPIDVTLSEIALETFFPADAATADALRSLSR